MVLEILAFGPTNFLLTGRKKKRDLERDFKRGIDLERKKEEKEEERREEDGKGGEKEERREKGGEEGRRYERKEFLDFNKL